MSRAQIKIPVHVVLGAATVAAALLAGCQDLPLNRAVQQDCANASNVKACEDADYARRYAEERARNRNVTP